MDPSPPGSSVRGVSQTRIQEWFAISFFGGSSWLRPSWATREAPSQCNMEEQIWLPIGSISFTLTFVFYCFCYKLITKGSFPGGSVVKNLPAMQESQETQVWSLGWKDPLEEGKAPHSSILAWRIPWTEEPGRLYSPWGHKRVGYDLVTKQQLIHFLIFQK